MNAVLVLAFALFFLPFLSQAAGQAQWEGQINDAFSQARQSTSQMKGKSRAEAERYLNQAEALWKQSQAKVMWYTQQQAQQQNQMNKTYMQQQNSNLFMQQQFLKNQSNAKSKNLQTINPFGDYLFHGVSLRPEDGKLQKPGTIPATVYPPSNTSNLWDNPIAGGGAMKTKKTSFDPYANDSSVVDLRASKTLTPDLLRKNESARFDNPMIFDEPKTNTYSDMSDERLGKKQAALTDALRETQLLMSENADGFGNIESDAVAGREEAIKTASDAAMTVALGVSSGIAEKNSARLLDNAINMSPGSDKIEAMKLSANAIKLSKDVGNASKLKDTADFLEYGDKGDLGEAAGQGAMMLGDALIKAPSRFNPTPIAAVPGTVKLGIDTALVWTNYVVLNQEYKRQEELSKQLEANRQKLFKQLQEVIAEQKRRSSVNSLQ